MRHFREIAEGLQAGGAEGRLGWQLGGGRWRALGERKCSKPGYGGRCTTRQIYSKSWNRIKRKKLSTEASY